MTGAEARTQLDVWRGRQVRHPKVIGEKDVVDLLLDWAEAHGHRSLSYSSLRTGKNMDDLQIAFVTHVLTLMLLGVSE